MLRPVQGILFSPLVATRPNALDASLGQPHIQAVEGLMQTKHIVFYQILEKLARMQCQQRGQALPWKLHRDGQTLGRGRERVMHERACRAHTKTLSWAQSLISLKFPCDSDLEALMRG